jgi:hypothetical protein
MRSFVARRLRSRLMDHPLAHPLAALGEQARAYRQRGVS